MRVFRGARPRTSCHLLNELHEGFKIYELQKGRGSWSKKKGEGEGEGLKSIYKIDCGGVNLDEKVFEYDESRGDLCVEFRGHDVVDHGGVWNKEFDPCFAGDRVFIFAKGRVGAGGGDGGGGGGGEEGQGDGVKDYDDYEKEGLLVINLCCCKICNPRCPRVIQRVERGAVGKPIDTTVLEPEGVETRICFVDQWVPRSDVKVNLVPGCTDKFDLAKDAHWSNRKRILFYAKVNLNDIKGFPWAGYQQDKQPASELKAEEEDGEEEEELIAVKICFVGRGGKQKAVNRKFGGQSSLMEELFEGRKSGWLTDFSIVSSDGVAHPVHKLVLAAQSKVFEDLFSKADSPEVVQGSLKLFETEFNAKVVGSFLRVLYQNHQHEDMSAKDFVDRDFGIVSAILKLSHRFQTLRVSVTFAKLVIRGWGWDHIGTQDMYGLLDLYEFAQKFNKQLIMVRLLKVVKYNIKEVGNQRMMIKRARLDPSVRTDDDFLPPPKDLTEGRKNALHELMYLLLEDDDDASDSSDSDSDFS